jgi:ABC-type branched-subunit amino acid transport system ATPase component
VIAGLQGERDPLLMVRDLRRSYGGVRAVESVSFDVREGSLTGIIGPNGAGKSTVLGMIAGSIRPDAGTVRMAGTDMTRLPPYRVAQRGVIRTFQTASVFPRLTVLENLLLGAGPGRGESIVGALVRRRAWRGEEQQLVRRARALLSSLGLRRHEDLYAGELSGGERRLVEIARALMGKPRLLLLDEPMAGVSRTVGLEIERLLARLSADGMTLLMIEHELDVVERICTSVIVMARGKVLLEGNMAEIRASEQVRRAYLVG